MSENPVPAQTTPVPVSACRHNARGAGRKAKFTDDQVDEIRRLREDGNTIKEIAKRYNCSVGLIHKLINEK